MIHLGVLPGPGLAFFGLGFVLLVPLVVEDFLLLVLLVRLVLPVTSTKIKYRTCIKKNLVCIKYYILYVILTR